MNPITLILWTLIYRPIFNIIAVLLAIFGGNLGLAIILLTIIVRLLLLGPSLHANKMQKDMVDIQPRLKELQEQHKDNPQKLAEETMKLFKSSGSNPLKGCLMMLVQLPVFLGLFYVIKDLSEKHIDMVNVYSFLVDFVGNSLHHINHYFFGMDLFAKGGLTGLILAVIAAVVMYLQIKVTMLNKSATPSIPGGMPSMPKMPDMSKMMEMMNMFMIFMMALFVYTMPAGIGLYIITTTLFTVIQFTIQYKELVKVKLKAAFSK